MPGVIAFGICVSSAERYTTLAEPGIRSAAGEHATILIRHDARSIFKAYNSILDEARALPDLEALVLLHDDLVIRDPRVLDTLRRVFADESIGLVGAHGARDVESLWWWHGERRGHISDIGDNGIQDFRRFDAHPEDVEVVDGCFMALSRWAVHTVRFDERFYRGFHAYDVDFCFTVRSLGKRVVVADLDVHHDNRITETIPNERVFLSNNRRWRAKWGFEARSALPARLLKLRIADHWPLVDRLNLRFLRRSSTRDRD